MRILKACLFLIPILLLPVSGCGRQKVTAPEPPAASASATAAAPTATAAAPARTAFSAPAARPTPQELTLAVFTPTPTPSPVPTPSPTPVPFLGSWICRFEGSDIVLTVDPAGTGTVRYGDKEQPVFWAYSEGKLILTGVRAVFEAEFSGNAITITDSDGTLVFTGKEQQ